MDGNGVLIVYGENSLPNRRLMLFLNELFTTLSHPSRVKRSLPRYRDNPTLGMFCLMIMGIKIQEDHSSRDSIRLVDKENVANQLKTYFAIW